MQLLNLIFFLSAMLVANDAFGEAVKEVYEPDWPGRDKLIQYLEVCNIIKHQFS